MGWGQLRSTCQRLYNTLRQDGPSTCPHFLSILIFMSVKGSVVSVQPRQPVRGERKLQLCFVEKLMVPLFRG